MIPPPETFSLTETDKATHLWLRLTQHFEKRLADARVRNDNPELGEFQTATLRGEIRVLKGILQLGADRPVMTGGDER